MNWYKTAKRSLGDSFIKDKLDFIFRQIVQADKSGQIKEIIEHTRKTNHQFIYGKSSLEIGELLLSNNMAFNIESITAKIIMTPNKKLQVGGTTSIHTLDLMLYRMFRRDETELNINPIKILLYIYMPYGFGIKDYNELYYELLNALRHEVEHAISGIDKIVGNENEYYEGNDIMGKFKYLTSPLEIEAFATASYTRAKREKRNIKDVMKNYIEAFLYAGQPVELKDMVKRLTDQTIEIWMNYAAKRFPNLKKQHELVQI